MLAADASHEVAGPANESSARQQTAPLLPPSQRRCYGMLRNGLYICT